MSKTYDDIARAFVEGRAARIGNAHTDGRTYWLHGSPIAVQKDGEVAFDFCGWRTVTTAAHMNRIISAGKLQGYASRAQKGGSPDQFTLPAPWAKAAPELTPGGHKPPVARYHRYDAWRGHAVPALAVAGSSDTGMWSDSPAPSDEVEKELKQFQEVLREQGIRSSLKYGETTNVFAAKRWVMVSPKDFERAAQLTVNWLDEHRDDTRFIHDADLDTLGYVVTSEVA